MTVLVVDDEPDIRMALKTSLEMEGYTVITASDGLEALEKIDRLHPSVVLLDLMMPKLDGFGVIRALGLERPKVIAMTALGVNETAKFAKAIGVSHVLAKPFDLEEMNTLVARCMA